MDEDEDFPGIPKSKDLDDDISRIANDLDEVARMNVELEA